MATCDTRRVRWSDNDQYFGPFTYAKERGCWRFSAVLSSGCEDWPGNKLRLQAFCHTLIMILPVIIKPFAEKIKVGSAWSPAEITRMGRDWYWSFDERKYGFSCSKGFLQVFLGRQTHDSSTTKIWCKFLPWTQWRFIRHSFYGLDGEHFATNPNFVPGSDGLEHFYKCRAIEDSCPSRVFSFSDFDGERLTARTRIEEREWRFGTGYFKWLSNFRRPKISRSLDIEFSGETGRRKGSWKGGTIGHGIDMLPGELHGDAFRRYCAEHQMVFDDEQAKTALLTA